MRKITMLCFITCTLASSCNTFGMLTKTSRTIATYKKIRSFHTNTPTRSIFEFLAWQDASDASKKAGTNQDLLLKIIQQNEDNNKLLKENNALLRTILNIQNFTHQLPSEKSIRDLQQVLGIGYTQCGLEVHKNLRMLQDTYNIETYAYNSEWD